MARGRESKSTTLEKMIRVLQTVNALAPHNPLEQGEPVSLDRFCELCGLDEKDCRRIIDKINYGCGDALPAAWIEVDDDGNVVPQRLAFAFDGLMRLSRSEAFSLLVALRSSGMDSDGHLARLVRGALPHFDLDRFHTVAGGECGPSGALETIADAVAGRLVLTIDYCDAKGGRSTRQVEPRSVWYDTSVSAWSFSAWCRTRNGMRTFRLDRLQAAPTATGETFETRGEEAREGLDTSQAQLAVLAIHDSKAIDVKSWPGLEACTLPSAGEAARLTEQELACGGYIAQIPWLAGSVWLAQAVVSSLGAVEVASPAELREEVRELAEALLKKLG